MSLLSELRQHPAATLALRKSIQTGCNGALTRLEGMYALGNIDRVIFTGVSSGFASALGAVSLLHSAGMPALAVESPALLERERTLITQRTMVIAVSCGPDEWETTKLCTAMQNHPGLVTVAASRSPISELGALRFHLEDGGTGTLPTTAYTNACAMVLAMAVTLTQGVQAAVTVLGERLEWYAYIQEGCVKAGMAKTRDVAAMVEKLPFVYFAASDLSYGSAREAARLMQACAPFEAGVLSLREVLQHKNPGCVVFFDFTLACRADIDRAEEQVRAAGGKTVLITNRDLAQMENRKVIRMGVRDVEAAAMCETVPVEMLAAYFKDGNENFV